MFDDFIKSSNFVVYHLESDFDIYYYALGSTQWVHYVPRVHKVESLVKKFNFKLITQRPRIKDRTEALKYY